jgi:phosphatidylinositol kinase/protein kinase (PI-3  family)
LSIRTYRIVPLAPQAGVVQWLDNTIPLGDLLSHAHNRYLSLTFTRIYPKDWTLPKCRKEMQAEHSKTNTTNQSKLLLYQKIEQNLHAVFGKLFFELYRSPNEWYDNRRRFMRSLATTSIAGYVLGIGNLMYYYPGDRHAQNILFDKKTGELIHIDLGIAFDQGKLLSTPELVPFRLTRDLGNIAWLIIVDVMGITGTRGVFLRGCEETLRLLRNDSEILFTLLDVFRYDPLYTW